MQQSQAMVTMRDQLADLAVQAASRVVKTNLNTAGHTQLIDEAIANLSTVGARNGAASTRGGTA
jgi:F0F1-type ATP synthase membrane subunit b/b'